MWDAATNTCLREKDVGVSFVVVDRKASASADAFFLITVPASWN